MSLPKNFLDLKSKYPEIGKHYKELSEKCYNAGPLDRKTAHLIKLGMSIASHSEGSTHTHVRLAKEAGATDDEIQHAVLLSLTTLGWPTLGAAWSWVNDIL
jgi:alkylhydroperoxidase/carboxymuconolactone decarboxylase family protein YurZ